MNEIHIVIDCSGDTERHELHCGDFVRSFASLAELADTVEALQKGELDVAA